jgi:phage-related protein
MSTSKPLVWLSGEVKTPPFSTDARIEAGFLLRQLQEGENLSMPHSRSMPSIGSRCHELRITDTDKIWRIINRIDVDAIVILHVFQKTTNKTPRSVIDIFDTLRSKETEILKQFRETVEGVVKAPLLSRCDSPKEPSFRILFDTHASVHDFQHSASSVRSPICLFASGLVLLD